MSVARQALLLDSEPVQREARVVQRPHDRADLPRALPTTDRANADQGRRPEVHPGGFVEPEATFVVSQRPALQDGDERPSAAQVEVVGDRALLVFM